MYIYRGKFDWYENVKDEAITIIFPTSCRHGEPAYVCWQWTRSPEGQVKANFIDVGTVNFKPTPTFASENTFTLSCPNYKFDVVPTVNLAHDFESLSLVMHHHEDQRPINLTLVYGSRPTGTSTPSVYAGKMDWSDSTVSAANEMFLVVIPESFTTEKPLCAFWQWNKRSGEDTKESVDCLVQIQSSPDSDAAVFTFTDSYRFAATLGEGGKKLVVTMKSLDGTTRRTTDLVLLPLLEKTCAILNDTQEVVTCTLRESGTATIDKFLAGAGVLAAIAGLATLPASTTIGALVAVPSAALALYGAAHTFTDPPDAIRAALFPNESIRRQYEDHGNDLEVLFGKIEVDKGRKFLVISLGRKEEVDSAELKLSALLEDPKLQVWNLLMWELPETSSLLTFRELKFSSIGLVGEREAKPLDDSLIDGGLFSVKSSDAKQLYHGRLSQPDADDPFEFEYQRNSFVAVGQSAKASDSGGVEDGIAPHTILTLSDHKLVLKLLNYCIDGSGSVYVAHCEDDDEVKVAIQKEEASGSPYVAYWFNDCKDGKILSGAKGTTDWKVKSSDLQGDSVYLVAASGPLVYRKIVTS